MRYVKSVLAGMATLTASVIVLAVGVMVKEKFATARSSTDYIWNSYTDIAVWPVLCVALLLFGVGFYWEFRRVSMPSSPH